MPAHYADGAHGPSASNRSGGICTIIGGICAILGGLTVLCSGRGTTAE
jgi:hypothetical protein